MDSEFLSTSEAAAKLGISRQRVLNLIEDGRLPAFKIGRNYAVKAADLALVAYRPTGRPMKSTSEKEQPE